MMVMIQIFKREVNRSYNLNELIEKDYIVMPKVDFLNQASTPLRSTMFSHIEEEIGHFFKRFEDSNIKEEGVALNISCVPMTSTIRKEVRDYFEIGKNCLTRIAGSIEHLHYPYKGNYYQIDLMFYNNETEINGVEFFNPSSELAKKLFNQFASYCGYRLSENGLSLRIIDANGRAQYLEVTKDVMKAQKILGLKHKSEKEIMTSPETFCEWILDSGRYDSNLFKLRLNSESFQFEKDVEKILGAIEVEFSAAPAVVDFRLKDCNLKNALNHERILLGRKFIRNVSAFCKNVLTQPTKNAEITGRTLIKMGYEEGSIFKTIMTDIAAKFSEEDSIQKIKVYILGSYPLYKYGKIKNVKATVKP